jgi:hypothetical protein
MKKDVPLCINFLTNKTPYKGPGADSEEKHEPVSDIDTAAAEGLKVLDPNRPIREADIRGATKHRLLDHLVGAGNQVWWQGKTDCSGGSEID